MDELSKLIVRAQNGDSEAFGEIYSLFLRRIFRFINFSVNDYELSQDLTQNTFLKAWRSINRFSVKKGSFQAFLFTIARNSVIDWYRKRKELPLKDVAEPASLVNVEEKVIRDEENLAVHRSISKLNFFEREIVTLRYFEDLTFAEIAKVVGKREGAIRVRVYRVIKNLKRHIEGEK